MEFTDILKLILGVAAALLIIFMAAILVRCYRGKKNSPSLFSTLKQKIGLRENNKSILEPTNEYNPLEFIPGAKIEVVAFVSTDAGDAYASMFVLEDQFMPKADALKEHLKQKEWVTPMTLREHFISINKKSCKTGNRTSTNAQPSEALNPASHYIQSIQAIEIAIHSETEGDRHKLRINKSDLSGKKNVIFTTLVDALAECKVVRVLSQANAESKRRQVSAGDTSNGTLLKRIMGTGELANARKDLSDPIDGIHMMPRENFIKTEIPAKQKSLMPSPGIPTYVEQRILNSLSPSQGISHEKSATLEGPIQLINPSDLASYLQQKCLHLLSKPESIKSLDAFNRMHNALGQISRGEDDIPQQVKVTGKRSNDSTRPSNATMTLGAGPISVSASVTLRNPFRRTKASNSASKT